MHNQHIPYPLDDLQGSSQSFRMIR